MKYVIKKLCGGLMLIGCLCLLSACAPKTLDAPCDAFGQHCEPKIPINQWTP